MPLTHVHYWQERSWRKIDAEEASKMFPHGAAAQSGLFRCSICDQYVTLTREGKYVSYFRHSSADEDKECSDRSLSASTRGQFTAQGYNLPLKICVESSTRFSFELGFIPLPEELLNKEALIRINGNTSGCKQTYSAERLLAETVTYFSVGDEPQKEYYISVLPKDPKVLSYWPQTVDGVSAEGTLFDFSSGKKLPAGADVVVSKPYYILSAKPVKRFVTGVNVKDISTMRVGLTTWKIYEVTALGYSKASADFFLDYHCRLTDAPVMMTPIWPVCIRSPYVYKHDGNDLFLYFAGDATPKIYPTASVKMMPPADPKMIYVKSFLWNRQQLVSLGRSGVLKFSYFWQQELRNDSKVLFPKINDTKGNEITEDEIPVPAKGTVFIIFPCDGLAEISEGGMTIERRNAGAGETVTLEGIKPGQVLSIIIGCDIVREIRIKKKAKREDSGIVEKLEKCTGTFVPAGHSLGAVISRYPEDEQLKNYIYNVVRTGKIREDALRILKASVSR